MTTRDSDDGALPVLVVGAGPVGQTTALLIDRWNPGVLLFDERLERDAVGSKAICQARDVLDVWELVGVGRTLAEEGVTWTTARTFYRHHDLGSWEFVDRGQSTFPAFVNIGQQRTEELLDKALSDASIETTWGHRLVDLRQDESSVTATFETPAGPVEVVGSHLVLATGARSDALRTLLGLGFEGQTFSDQFLICDIKADLPGWEKERRFYFDPEWNPGRQVLIHACPDSTFRIDWQVPHDYDVARDEETGGLDARIRHIVGDVPYKIVWRSVYRFHSRHTDRMQVGRVLLAGDVAHLVSPFGARGLNTGVLDAENAAWKIGFARRGWAGPGLLASYDAERMAATRENIEVTSATMRFLVPQTPEELERRRRTLEAAAASPGAAAAVDSGRFAEPFWYVDSPLTTSDPARPFEGRPAKGHTPAPAPGVLVPDVPLSCRDWPDVQRLRELVRRGFTLLVETDEYASALVGAAREVSDCPVHVLVLDRCDRANSLVETLGLRAGEAWLVRPDGYVAAVAPAASIGDLTGALERALGR